MVLFVPMLPSRIFARTLALSLLAEREFSRPA